jgi:hypothetical protein
MSKGSHKPHKQYVMSNVECAHAQCGWVNGRDKGSPVKRLIKQNVVDRMGTERPLECYPCQVFHKTGKRVRNKEEVKTMKAGA